MGAGIITKYTYVAGAEQSVPPAPDAPENPEDPVSLAYLNSAITISGNKVFTGTIFAANLTGTNTGDVTLNSLGSTPNASGLSLSGQVLRMQPADETNPGGLTITSQVFTGNKEFSNALEWRHANNSAATGANAILTLPTTSAVRVTNASLTSIAGVATHTKSQLFILVNMVGADIAIVNDSGSAGTGEKIITGTGSGLTLTNTACIILYKDITTNVWRVVGGSGSGGGGGGGSVPTIFGSTGTPRSIVAATGITTGASHMSNSDAYQDIYVEGSIAGESIAATVSVGTVNGQRMTIIGRNDSNVLTLDATTTNVVLNGTATLGANDILNLRFDGTNWVEVSRNF